MLRIRYSLITAALFLFANWTIHAYRSSVLDADFLAYGQSIVVGGTATARAPVTNRAPFPTSAPPNQNAMAVPRPAGSLAIEADSDSEASPPRACGTSIAVSFCVGSDESETE